MGLDSHIRYDVTTSEDIVYWRKHNAMHNWFAIKAIKLGIVENVNDFNCEKLVITQEILNELVSDVKEGKLECTNGFFFGGQYDPKDGIEADLEDLSLIQLAINEGKQPYYWSWW